MQTAYIELNLATGQRNYEQSTSELAIKQDTSYWYNCLPYGKFQWGSIVILDRSARCPQTKYLTCDCCAECGGLGHGGPEDGDAEEVGLDLHEEAVLRHAAVRQQAAAHQAQTALRFHRVQDLPEEEIVNLK